jgi:peptide/nickel transport system ATP-binding protein
MSDDRVLVRLDGISKSFRSSGRMLDAMFGAGAAVGIKAVDHVSFDIARGETFGIVGESGSGKSTLARIVTGLIEPTEGAVWFDGLNLSELRTRAQQMPVRRRAQMIFQDPTASLNPRWRARDIVAEPIRTHRLRAGRPAIERRVAETLELVGLSHMDGGKYPHELSGGQRQRVAIARALASEAEFLVCDEPTSALDVSIQAQILNLLVDLQRELALTYLVISHNLPVVNFMADKIGVLFQGRLVECGDARDVLSDGWHPYTRSLIDNVLDPRARRHRGGARGLEQAGAEDWELRLSHAMSDRGSALRTRASQGAHRRERAGCLPHGRHGLGQGPGGRGRNRPRPSNRCIMKPERRRACLVDKGR